MDTPFAQSEPHYFEAFVFDLDGTLLDTLPDLVVLTNAALRENGFPERTTAEILSYVGNGARSLISQAVPKDAGQDAVQAVLDQWKANYVTLGHRMTVPYQGMPEALGELKERGAKLAVLSNKFDAATRAVISEHFPGVFHAVHGECEEFPRKPNPEGLWRVLDELGVCPQATAYVGDSAGDMLVAHRAGTFGLGVSWGYQPEAMLRDAGAQAIINAPMQLLDFSFPRKAKPSRCSAL